MLGQLCQNCVLKFKTNKKYENDDDDNDFYRMDVTRETVIWEEKERKNMPQQMEKNGKMEMEMKMIKERN